MSLSKSVNTLTLLSSAVAGIIGSGWLLSPLVCAKMTGPAAVITWIVGGILMMIIASTFVILTRTVPITGGTVRFFQLTHGHFAGFGFSWIAWLAWIALSPIEMMAIVQYASNQFPALMISTGAAGSLALTPLGTVISIVGMILIGLINSAGMKVYRRINYFILAIKLIIPITAAFLLLSFSFHPDNFTQQGFMPFGIKSIFAALPLAGVIYSFIGFNPVVQLAGESTNPKRAIPIAIFGALFICMIIYTLVQIAFIGALPANTLSHGFSLISFVGDKGPYAGLLTLLGFTFFVKALYFDACVSPFSTSLVQSVATSRITYAMSQNGYFPAFLSSTNKNGTPVNAIIFNIIVGLLFFLPFPSWQHMVGFLVSCLVIGYVVGPMSLMVLASQQPELFYPFSKKMIHALCLLGFYICNLLIFWSGWAVVFKIMILFCAGYALLALTMWQNKNAKIKDTLFIARGSWTLLYLIGIALISYLGSFGGHNIIPFGMDFMVIAVFSCFVYSVAYVAAVARGQLLVISNQ